MKKGEKRKQELLLIAYRMFLQKGYEDTSVDEIITEAGIAKGTFYYYYKTKEQLLEDVIGMMLDRQTDTARQVVNADIPVPQKLVGIIASVQLTPEEQPIQGALHRPENVLLHSRIHRRLMDALVPLLTQAAEEGIGQGIFSCDNVPERVRMLLSISSDTFDDGNFTERDVVVFIDLTEKLIGAKPGTMGFISELIRRGGQQDERK